MLSTGEMYILVSIISHSCISFAYYSFPLKGHPNFPPKILLPLKQQKDLFKEDYLSRFHEALPKFIDRRIKYRIALAVKLNVSEELLTSWYKHHSTTQPQKKRESLRPSPGRHIKNLRNKYMYHYICVVVNNSD